MCRPYHRILKLLTSISMQQQHSSLQKQHSSLQEQHSSLQQQHSRLSSSSQAFLQASTGALCSERKSHSLCTLPPCLFQKPKLTTCDAIEYSCCLLLRDCQKHNEFHHSLSPGSCLSVPDRPLQWRSDSKDTLSLSPSGWNLLLHSCLTSQCETYPRRWTQ